MRLNNSVMFASVYLISRPLTGDRTDVYFVAPRLEVSVQHFLNQWASFLCWYTNKSGWSLAPLHMHVKTDWVILPVMLHFYPEVGGRVSLESLPLDGKHLWVIAVTCDISRAPWIEEEIPCCQDISVLHISENVNVSINICVPHARLFVFTRGCFLPATSKLLFTLIFLESSAPHVPRPLDMAFHPSRSPSLFFNSVL